MFANRICLPQIPFSVPALAIIEFIAIAFVEAKRNEETDPVKRCYPGGSFDPMGLGSGPNAEVYRTKEIKNGELLHFSEFCAAQRVLITLPNNRQNS